MTGEKKYAIVGINGREGTKKIYQKTRREFGLGMVFVSGWVLLRKCSRETLGLCQEERRAYNQAVDQMIEQADIAWQPVEEVDLISRVARADGKVTPEEEQLFEEKIKEAETALEDASKSLVQEKEAFSKLMECLGK